MSKAYDRGKFDWLVESCGAVVPAAAAAVAAAKIAPAHGLPLSMAVLASFCSVYALAFALMRIVPAEPHRLTLPAFDPPMIVTAGEIDDVLLLNQPLFEEEFYTASEAVAELLLDDPLPEFTPNSRVVHLFGDGRMPTAGQLQRRIDAHLADGQRPAPKATIDAADALGEALAELRRSMRQG